MKNTNSTTTDPAMAGNTGYRPLIQGSLFSGMGGFDLASDWMGWFNAFHCEWNPFVQRILKYYWPDAESYHDITKTDFTIWRRRIDVLTGGFPCQPYSVAGKQKGKADERHLWPEMRRTIREVQPTWVVGENVRGLVNWSSGLVFHEVQAELEDEGYEVLPFLLPAVSVDAPHRRDRIWFIARHTQHDGLYATKERGNDEESSLTTRQDKIWESSGANCIQSSDFAYRNGTGFQEEGPEQQTARVEQYGKLDRQATSNAYGDGHRSDNEFRKIGFEKGEIPAIIEERKRVWSNDRRISTTRYAADTNSELQQRWGDKERPKEAIGHVGAPLCRNAWENFPTQPPVCNGNDGLPAELDGITVAKWRNESIKAGGNAIVPQVAYQIFQAIELYERQLSGL